MQKILDFNYIDLLDESDEILCHKYQLIYTTGQCSFLQGVISRIRVAQALLGAFESDNQVRYIIENQNVYVTDRSIYKKEAFNNLRIVEGENFQDLNTALVNAVLQNPPYDLAWLNDLDSN